MKNRIRLRHCSSDTILFSGQPIAVVVAETLEQARYAASLVKVTYDKQTPSTDLSKVLDKAYGNGNNDPNRGNPAEAFAASDAKIEAEYTIPIEHHNAMEPHASIASWENKKLTIYDKTQGVQRRSQFFGGNFQDSERKILPCLHRLSAVLSVRLCVLLRIRFSSAMAAREVKRPVKLVYTRRQLATAHGYRPYSIQNIKIGADKSGKLTSIIHSAVTNTSSYDNFSDGVVDVSRSLYVCPNVQTDEKIAKTDLQTPLWMRAPGGVSGAFALESALDELSYKLKIDPLELRLINYAEVDPDNGKPFSSQRVKEMLRGSSTEIRLGKTQT